MSDVFQSLTKPEPFFWLSLTLIRQYDVLHTVSSTTAASKPHLFNHRNSIYVHHSRLILYTCVGHFFPPILTHHLIIWYLFLLINHPIRYTLHIISEIIFSVWLGWFIFISYFVWSVYLFMNWLGVSSKTKTQKRKKKKEKNWLGVQSLQTPIKYLSCV